MDSSLADGDAARTVDAGEMRSIPSWVVALTPHTVDPRVDVPSDAVQVYLGMHFARPAPPSDASIRLVRSERWRSTRDGRVEVGIDVRCSIDDTEIASALWVCRGSAGEAPDHGHRTLPRAPDPADHSETVGCARITRADVAAYATRTGALHELHVDPEACRQLGFDDVVVQGALYVDAIVQAAQLTRGRIDAWFLAATTATTRCQLDVDGAAWCVRAGDRPAVVAVVGELATGRLHPSRP